MAINMPLPIPPTYAETLRSPLLAYNETFGHDKMVLSLSEEAAEILDDIRFLTLSMTSVSGTSSTSKIQSTAACRFFLSISCILPNVLNADTL